MLRKWRGEEGKLRIDFYSLPTDGEKDREEKILYARRKKPFPRASDSQTVTHVIFFFENGGDSYEDVPVIN